MFHHNFHLRDKYVCLDSCQREENVIFAYDNNIKPDIIHTLKYNVKQFTENEVQISPLV